MGQAYVDDGAQICVITQSCVERVGSKFLGCQVEKPTIKNVKRLGMIKDHEVDVFNVKVEMDFHVMPGGLGAYRIILGRPWLPAVRAIQDWRYGNISLNKHGKSKSFDMHNKRPVEEKRQEKLVKRIPQVPQN